jgi:protein O-mannosyl-transferase
MNNKLFIIILACICLGLYAGYLNNDFVFDDKVLVEQNPLIKSVSFMPRIFKTGIYDYWSGPQEYDRMYRPLQMLSYFFDYNLWGNHPAGFRFTNLLLHLFNALLVFYLLEQVFKDRLLAQAANW